MFRKIFAVMALSGLGAAIGWTQAEESQEASPAKRTTTTTVGDKSTTPPQSRAPVVVPDDAPDPLARISEALDKRVRFAFREVPLQDVIAQFETALEIDINIDRKGLAHEGIDDKEPVTVKSSGVALRSALRMVLNPLRLTWTIENETLVIITQIAQERTSYRIKTYDVTDLIDAEANPKENPRAFANFDLLMKAIVNNTPGDWAEIGGMGTISPVRIGERNLLVVRHSQKVHEQIDDLLADLRKTYQESR